MTRKRILCFGDSNTFGWIGTLQGPARRYPSDIRWTGRLASLLGDGFEIIEEGLGGRTIAHNFVVGSSTVIPGAGLDALAYLPACILSHLPLDLVIVMLGSNDLKSALGLSAEDIAADMARLADAVLTPFWSGLLDYPAPRLLLVSPPFIGDRKMSLAGERYVDAPARSRRLPELYRAIADARGCGFLAASDALDDSTAPGEAHGPDGMHLDERDHQRLAEAIFQKVTTLV